ncbi:DNA (cytosine-5-)-methyltransferase [Aeromonas veronii]|uniref:DNA (cytosine-5-)-methyltransferase n=1 Tax=Aeromonas veronii TaxID=654 RepID=UPI003D23FF9A
MIYGSVCSGVEAASLAWEPLGWNPAWFAEIEPFPSAVLAHHWPHITNLGDMTKIATAVLKGDVVAPDILVGGTPCQAFSVAGAREGLADDRGFLTIKYVELANAIDQKRAAAGAVPCITVWENVPGVLSSKDNAFGAFLGFLAGEDCELVPPGKKWENAGCVLGPQRAIAWRILDAQHFGVAQRRRRVFVVASAREGFDPAKVLFECEGVRRDSAPSREAGKAVAALTANGVGTCGADDNQGQAGHLIPAVDICPTLRAGGNATGGDRPPGTDVDTAESLQVVMSIHGTQDPDTNTEPAHTLGRNHGQENAVCVTGAITHTPKAEGFDASEDGTGRGQPIVPVAYGIRTANTSSNGWGIQEEVTHTLDTAQGIAVAAPAISLQTDVTPKASVELAFTLKLPSSSGGGQPAAAMTPDLAVRRLTPVECERLQGFPDGHTDVPYRSKPASDGPRYKAIGNSMAVPCMAFIGRRIDLHLSEIDLPAVDEEAA